jgi:hypothetical protein
MSAVPVALPVMFTVSRGVGSKELAARIFDELCAREVFCFAIALVVPRKSRLHEMDWRLR